MKLNKTKKSFSVVAAGCLGVLGLLTVAMLCPMQQNKASADVATEDASSAVALAASAKVHSVVSIGVQSKLDIDLVPKGDYTFGKSAAYVVVTTNNKSGYSLYVKMAGEEQALTSSDTTITEQINPVSGSVIEANFATAANKDTWGYNLAAGTTGGTTYTAVPKNSEAAAATSEEAPATKTTYTLTFGTAVSLDLPAGTYTNSVLVSAVANPLEVTSLEGLTYMQDMTPEICANSKLGATNTLIDVRDGKSYEVAKLQSFKAKQADPTNENAGRCWMTQNLALNIDANYATKLNSTNTDVAAGWNWPSFSTSNDSQGHNSITQTTVPAAIASPSQTTTYSWNFGKWVLATPTIGESCGDVTNINQCTKVGFVDVSDETKWQPTFASADGEWKLSTGEVKNTYVAANCTAGYDANNICQGGTYDPHYLIGNYYQYNTATAGSGGTITNADAAWSLCPKGWGLPTSGDALGANGETTGIKAGSFLDLLYPYGLQSKVGGSTSQDNNSLGYNIAKAPLYYVRSGMTSVENGRFRLSGMASFTWSNHSFTNSIGAYRFDFNTVDVDPSRDYGRNYAFPLRCLAD